MLKFEREEWPFVGVVALLIVQAALLVLSLDSLWMISIFCTATHVPWLETFGYIHVAYVGLLVLGIVSLSWRRGRLIYISLISAALLALPMQGWLVKHDYLYCDAP